MTLVSSGSQFNVTGELETGGYQKISRAERGVRAYHPNTGNISVNRVENTWDGRFILDSKGRAIWTKDQKGILRPYKACGLKLKGGIVYFQGLKNGKFVWWPVQIDAVTSLVV